MKGRLWLLFRFFFMACIWAVVPFVNMIFFTKVPIASLMNISLVPSPIVGFIGCALCGLSVGIMWPGVFSKAAASVAKGGTAMFALLALAGDIGCSGGPTVYEKCN